MKSSGPKPQPWVRELHKATIGGEISKLEADISEYEMLKSGKAPVIPVHLSNTSDMHFECRSQLQI